MAHLPPLPQCAFQVHEQNCPIRCINPDLGPYHHFTCRATRRLGMCPGPVTEVSK